MQYDVELFPRGIAFMSDLFSLSRPEFDKLQLTRADHFTACMFLGRGVYDTPPEIKISASDPQPAIRASGLYVKAFGRGQASRLNFPTALLKGIRLSVVPGSRLG